MEKDKRFTHIPTSWFKRRTPTEHIPELTGYEVLDFQKVERHICTMEVEFDNTSQHTLTAYVHANKIHTIGGPSIITHWSIQGTNPHGISISLKYIEDS